MVLKRLPNALRRRLRRLGDERGVSLIEAILMIIVLGITIVPLSQLSTSNLKFGSKTLMMTQGCLYAQAVMEHVYADYFSPDTSVGGYAHTLSGWNGSTASDPPSGYTGTVTISGLDSLHGVKYSTVTVTVSSAGIPDVIIRGCIIQ